MRVFLGMTLTAFLVGLPALPQDGLLRYLHHVSRLWNLQQLTLQMAKRRILVRAPSTVWSIPNTCLISSPALPWILSPTTCPCCTSQTSHTSSLKACSCCSPAWNTHPQYSSWLPSIPSGQISPHIKILLYYTSECHIFFLWLKKTLKLFISSTRISLHKEQDLFFPFCSLLHPSPPSPSPYVPSPIWDTQTCDTKFRLLTAASGPLHNAPVPVWCRPLQLVP